MRLILGDVLLWARGLPRLFSGQPLGREGGPLFRVSYKPGWGPWSFLPLYCTTYLAGTVLGYGVVSLSRAWYQRSLVTRDLRYGPLYAYIDGRHVYPFAWFMTRLLNWLVPGKHGVHTGPWLWGTASRRNLYS